MKTVDQEQIMVDDTAKEAASRVILFTISGETWGIDFRDIQEVLEVKKPTPVPKTPSFILGVINQRGRIITVVDFAVLLGEGENGGQGTRIVHLRGDRGNVGLLIRSNLRMDSLLEKLIGAGREAERSGIIPDASLETRIVQKDKAEINLVDGKKIIAFIERYPFSTLPKS